MIRASGETGASGQLSTMERVKLPFEDLPPSFAMGNERSLANQPAIQLRALGLTARCTVRVTGRAAQEGRHVHHNASAPERQKGKSSELPTQSFLCASARSRRGNLRRSGVHFVP